MASVLCFLLALTASTLAAKTDGGDKGTSLSVAMPEYLGIVIETLKKFHRNVEVQVVDADEERPDGAIPLFEVFFKGNVRPHGVFNRAFNNNTKPHGNGDYVEVTMVTVRQWRI